MTGRDVRQSDIICEKLLFSKREQQYLAVHIMHELLTVALDNSSRFYVVSRLSRLVVLDYRAGCVGV